MGPDHPFEGVLLACDLDGTLLSPGGTLDPVNTCALRTFLDGGGRFTVATGRTAHSVEANFPELASDLPGIFCNGAHLYDRIDRRTVRSSPLPASAHDHAAALLARFGGLGMEIFTDRGAFLVRTLPTASFELDTETLKVPRCTLDAVPSPWLKILLGGAKEDLLPVRAYLDAKDDGTLSIVSSSFDCLDIMAKGVSKGSALAYLRTFASAFRPIRWVVAVGDNENDLEMLAEADLAVVPENGVHPARSVADHVVPHHAEPILPNVLEAIRINCHEK